MEKIIFNIRVMFCVFCVGCVDWVLKVVFGVVEVNVNFVFEMVNVIYVEGVIILKVLMDVVIVVGYLVMFVEIGGMCDWSMWKQEEVEVLFCKMVVVVGFVLLVFVIEMGSYVIFGMYYWINVVVGQ